MVLEKVTGGIANVDGQIVAKVNEGLCMVGQDNPSAARLITTGGYVALAVLIGYGISRIK